LSCITELSNVIGYLFSGVAGGGRRKESGGQGAGIGGASSSLFEPDVVLLYALCLSYHFNAEAVLFACLSSSIYFIQPFKNAFLSRNLDQNMPKNAYFWKRSCKSP